jgi:hypothetical protein
MVGTAIRIPNEIWTSPKYRSGWAREGGRRKWSGIRWQIRRRRWPPPTIVGYQGHPGYATNLPRRTLMLMATTLSLPLFPGW